MTPDIVIGMPCGAPGYAFSVAFFTSLTATRADTSMGAGPLAVVLRHQVGRDIARRRPLAGQRRQHDTIF